MKKKICYITYGKTPSPVIESFSEAVFNSGYDVTVLTLGNPGEPRFEINDGRKIYRIQLPNRHKTKINMFYFLSKVVTFLKKYNFSIVHIHYACPYFGLIKMLSLTEAKYVFHILSFPSSKKRNGRKKKKITIFLQCLLMDKIIVQSEELKQHWMGIRSLRKAEIIPVGFDSKLFCPMDNDQKRVFRRRLNIHENQPVLVFCGAIAKLRELDRLIEAFKKVYEINSEVKLVLIGDGDALQEMKALTRYLQIESGVIFTGRIPHAEVSNYIAMADIGISYVPIIEKYNYNPPLKTFEYLACGLPSIATATVSNSKIINHNFNGILVDDSVDHIAKGILNLLHDKNKQLFLKANARKSIRTYNFDYIARNSLIPLYESLE